LQNFGTSLHTAGFGGGGVAVCVGCEVGCVGCVVGFDVGVVEVVVVVVVGCVVAEVLAVGVGFFPVPVGVVPPCSFNVGKGPVLPVVVGFVLVPPVSPGTGVDVGSVVVGPPPPSVPSSVGLDLNTPSPKRTAPSAPIPKTAISAIRIPRLPPPPPSSSCAYACGAENAWLPLDGVAPKPPPGGPYAGVGP